MPNKQSSSYREIQTFIRQFADTYLDDEYKEYAENVLDDLEHHPHVNLDRSTTQQWAASIIYLIARLNFLFNDSNISPDLICEFFKTNKSTTGNKATYIERRCDLYLGKEGYVTQDIVDMFTYYETEEGLIIPKCFFDRLGARKNANVKEEENIPIHERRKAERERHLQELREKAAKKRDNKDQLGLFGDES